MDSLERRIEALRAEVRRAVTVGDRAHARVLRAELRKAEGAWEDSLERLQGELAGTTLATEQSAGDPAATWRAAGEDGQANGPDAATPSPAAAGEPAEPLLPVREQVHQALTLLGAPAAPRLITTVHDAFFGGTLAPARLTSLRRDEERSFRMSPHARPYYLCAALTCDLLAPARGLLAVSTWPMERRVIGPLSLRVHYLEAAIRVAEGILRLPDPGPGLEAMRLLRRFAVNIPGAAGSMKPAWPQVIADAARAELAVHSGEDRALRRDAAARAQAQLGEVAQLFGARFGPVADAAAGA
jgi:hypothetical protein